MLWLAGSFLADPISSLDVECTMSLTVIGHVYWLGPVPATADVQSNWPPLVATFASLNTD